MFSKLGDIILRIFSLMGSLILFIPKIPQKLRNVNTNRIKEKIDTDNIKENVSKARDNLGINQKATQTTTQDNKIPPISNSENLQDTKVKPSTHERKDSDILLISTPFTSKEKEDTIFRLQVLSAAFLILSILYLFNFLNIIIFAILAILIAGYIIYYLFNRVKVMYGHDFPAYRDFFLMYLGVGIIILLVGTNTNLVMAFSFQYFPSLSILIFAIIAVFAVFIIFRIRYHRDYTYGVVIETGERMAYVKVEYDIRSNVKPDVYAVDNSYGALDGETVKLKTEEKLFSNTGNKPIIILKSVNKI